MNRIDFLLIVPVLWLLLERVKLSFWKALLDLITDLHNSNKSAAQITLLGEIIPEEKYALLGFVNGKDLLIEEDIWFAILSPKQLDALTNCLREKSYY